MVRCYDDQPSRWALTDRVTHRGLLSTTREVRMRRTGPLDTAFFRPEAPGRPFPTMAVMVPDLAAVPGGCSFGRLRTLIASRFPGISPLRQRLVPSGRRH